MEMGHGVPPIQQSLDHGIRPSLSVDVETEMPGDMFTQMRSVFTLQRMLALNRRDRPRRPQPTAPDRSRRRRVRHDRGRARQSPRAQDRHADAGQGRRRHHAPHGHDQRDAVQQRLRRGRAGHGHEQRRHGVHRRQGDEAGRPAGRRRSRSRSGATPNSRATTSSAKAGWKKSRV